MSSIGYGADHGELEPYELAAWLKFFEVKLEEKYEVRRLNELIKQ